MHGAGEGGDDATLIAAADRWLEGFYGKLAASSAWRDGTRLVVTWDEGGGGEKLGCCGGLAAGGRVGHHRRRAGRPARRDDATYSHYALLRSIESAVPPAVAGPRRRPVDRDHPRPDLTAPGARACMSPQGALASSN